MEEEEKVFNGIEYIIRINLIVILLWLEKIMVDFLKSMFFVFVVLNVFFV